MLKFIDISNHQQGIDISALSGIDGVICKATEGTYFIDRYFDDFMNASKEKGCIRGFYHFASGGDPVEEANYFMEHTKNYWGAAVPILDWEGNQSVWWVNRFVERIHEAKGVWPIIYANPWRFNQGNVNENCGRWIASYPEVTSPSFDQAKGWNAPETDGLVVGWQFCSDGHIDGYSGNLDCSLMYMDAAAWQKYACPEGGTPEPTPTPEPAPIVKHVHYALHAIGHGWWPEVCCAHNDGDDSYAGAPFTAHDYFYIYGDGIRKYRVHTQQDGWLPWVHKADISDPVNGLAGMDGHAIDGVQIDGDVFYRSQTVDREGWLDTVDGLNDFAGWYGENMDKVQCWPK